MCCIQANDAGYVIPGANARDVSPTGCSLGGCHGWLTPSLGLLSDNVLAYTVVTANGSIITFNSTHGTEENEAGQVSKTKVYCIKSGEKNMDWSC